jgi:hypothetical protein
MGVLAGEGQEGGGGEKEISRPDLLLTNMVLTRVDSNV